MKAYLQYLLADIKNAYRLRTSGPKMAHFSTLKEQLEEVEKWASGTDRPPSLGHQCGLNSEKFPPLDMLTEDEMHAIIKALDGLLLSWNMQAELPSEIPVLRAYPLMVNLLKEEAWYLPGGLIHLDFCTGYAPDCELKEYCRCLEYWNSEKT